MPAEPAFLNDKLEILVRKCIVFPANGSETCLVPMVARTVTYDDDIPSLMVYSRCVDMSSTYGDDYRKTQVTSHKTGTQSTYLFFYNLSPNLPINLNIAHVTGVTPSHLNNKKRLFWRGDVVAMKIQPQSELKGLVESLDADLSELKDLEEFLRTNYQGGYLELLLDYDENRWNRYLTHFRGPTSFQFGAPKSYWGINAAEKEEIFLHDLNELRCSIGRPPLPRPKSYTERAVTLYATFKSALSPRRKVTGPPKLPPELERRIFEMCALENPELCTVLVLVARRVYEWIDPILIATVCITENLESTKERDRPERFLVKLANGKPVEYYARHIKNLAICGYTFKTEAINRILAICSGVERLVLFVPTYDVDFFKDPQAGRNLRRLTINLQKFGPKPNFYHPCFANLTHLHLQDEDDEWPTYEGWETLTSLTHLAFVCAGPEQVVRVMQTWPTVRYVALGYYLSSERYKYNDADVTVDNSPHIREAWDVRVVCFQEIPWYDWERGARGEGDFWDLVEREVQRRLEEVESVD